METGVRFPGDIFSLSADNDVMDETEADRGDVRLDIVEEIVRELRRKRDVLDRLRSPGQLTIHLNPQNPKQPVILEIGSFKL